LLILRIDITGGDSQLGAGFENPHSGYAYVEIFEVGAID